MIQWLLGKRFKHAVTRKLYCGNSVIGLHDRNNMRILLLPTYDFLPWSTVFSDRSLIYHGVVGTRVERIKCVTVVSRREWNNT
jgi:hypothetical protein